MKPKPLEKLAYRIKPVIDELRKGPKTRKEILKNLKINKSTLTRYINFLEILGLIEKEKKEEGDIWVWKDYKAYVYGGSYAYELQLEHSKKVIEPLKRRLLEIERIPDYGLAHTILNDENLSRHIRYDFPSTWGLVNEVNQIINNISEFSDKIISSLEKYNQVKMVSASEMDEEERRVEDEMWNRHMMVWQIIKDKMDIRLYIGKSDAYYKKAFKLLSKTLDEILEDTIYDKRFFNIIGKEFPYLLMYYYMVTSSEGLKNLYKAFLFKNPRAINDPLKYRDIFSMLDEYARLKSLFYTKYDEMIKKLNEIVISVEVGMRPFSSLECCPTPFKVIRIKEEIRAKEESEEGKKK